MGFEGKGLSWALVLSRCSVLVARPWLGQLLAIVLAFFTAITIHPSSAGGTAGH
jgi:hypothetical protein